MKHIEIIIISNSASSVLMQHTRKMQMDQYAYLIKLLIYSAQV